MHSKMAKIAMGNEQWHLASSEFNAIMEIVENKTGLAFYYNYLLSTQPPEFEHYPKFLQKPDVRKSIHVGNLTYDDTSIPVYEHLSDDIPKSIKPWLEELLEHYKVMVYSGQLDVIIFSPDRGLSKCPRVEWKKH